MFKEYVLDNRNEISFLKAGFIVMSENKRMFIVSL